MNDRRSKQRFKLSLSSRIYSQNGTCRTEGLLVSTRNISSDGAYFLTEHPLPENVPVRVELSLPLPRSDSTKSKGSRLISTGTVIRQDHTGMAVKFDEAQLFPLLNANQN